MPNQFLGEVREIVSSWTNPSRCLSHGDEIIHPNSTCSKQDPRIQLEGLSGLVSHLDARSYVAQPLGKPHLATVPRVRRYVRSINEARACFHPDTSGHCSRTHES